MVITENTQQQFLSIIEEKKLQVVFQPIVCMHTQSIYGYEGLVRGPSDTSFQSPVVLFDTAAQMDMLLELDFLCRETVIRQYQKLQLQKNLFINVDPISMQNKGYRDEETIRIIEKNSIDPSSIVIEVTETHPIDDIELMQKAVGHYRNLGFRVALDDLGAGYSGLKLWSEIRPDFVKIDRHFINDVDTDKTKQQFIHSINQTAKGLGCKVITEGVETEEEYSTLRKQGIQFAQGYYFSRPKAIPPAEVSQTLFRKNIIRAKQVNEGSTVEQLIRPAVSIQANASVMEVGEIFIAMPNVESLVVVNKHEVLGLVIRKEFMNIYASRYGKELFGKKSIFRFTNRNVLRVEKNETLENASYQLTSSLNLYTEEFIILDQYTLLGKAQLIDLLHAITEIKVNRARYANPLTLLPGNVPIQQHLQQLFFVCQPFTICYFDLDNFKPFNDVYGFAKGDEIILYLATLLKKYADCQECFIGHIGGDDFVLVTTNSQWEDTVRKILKEFDANITQFYDEGNMQITAHDRGGMRRVFNLMTLSVGAVIVKVPCHSRKLDLAEEAAIAKHQAKNIEGSSLFIHSAPHCIETN